MPRTVPSGLATRLGTGSHFVSALIRVNRRNGAVERVTTASQDMLIDVGSGSETFIAAPGLKVGSLAQGTDGQPASYDFQLGVDGTGPLDYTDLVQRRYDRAAVRMWFFDQKNPELGAIKIFRGWFTDVRIARTGIVTVTCKGLLLKAGAIVQEFYSTICRTELGSRRCSNRGGVGILPNSHVGGNYKTDIERTTAYHLFDFARVRLAGAGDPSDYQNVYFECTTAGTTGGVAPTFDTTPDATTVDGSVVWTCRNAWLRYAQVASQPDPYTIELSGLDEPRADDETWFTNGLCYFRTGDFAGEVIDIRGWEAPNLLLWIPVRRALAVGDWVELHAGCDLVFETCRTRFANQKNFRGENNRPGVSALRTNYTPLGEA